MVEEPLKKRKLSHSSYSSGKFGTIVDQSSKLAAPSAPNLLEASMKVVQVKAVHRANEEVKKKGKVWPQGHRECSSFEDSKEVWKIFGRTE